MVLGAGIVVPGCAALALAPGSAALVGPVLFGIGMGLGLYIPANNSSIMSAIPRRMSATGGGLVNMARGLGTALGVALVTLCLHLASDSLALAALGLFGVVAGVTGFAANGSRAARP
jgi:hypothetical protein